jgi:hypothetical protein
MRRYLLPTLAAAVVLIPAAPAAASCAFLSSAEQEARADVVVEGTILAAEDGSARLAVERRIKGDAPAELEITGGGGSGVTSSVDILPRAGERWRIFGQDAGPATVWTSICEGSVRLDGPTGHDPGLAAATGAPEPATAPPSGFAALLAWLGALLGALG